MLACWHEVLLAEFDQHWAAMFGLSGLASGTWSAGLPKGRAGRLFNVKCRDLGPNCSSHGDFTPCHSVWNKVELATQAEPVPFEVWQACVGKLLREGELHKAAAFALAFHGMLRPGQLVALTVGDLQADLIEVVARLSCTKGSQRSGIPESVLIDHRPWLWLLV
eukprot:890884-Amphidinium_carterae.2